MVEVKEDSTRTLPRWEIVELEPEQRRLYLRWECCHRVDLRTPWWASRRTWWVRVIMRNLPLTTVASGIGW